MNLNEIKYDEDWDFFTFIGTDTETGKPVEIREIPQTVIGLLAQCIEKYELPFVVEDNSHKTDKEDGTHQSITPGGVKVIEFVEDGFIIRRIRHRVKTDSKIQGQKVD